MEIVRNKRKDRAGARLAKPLRTRFSSVLKVKINVNDWLAWADGSSIIPVRKKKVSRKKK